LSFTFRWVEVGLALQSVDVRVVIVSGLVVVMMPGAGNGTRTEMTDVEVREDGIDLLTKKE